MKRLMHVFVCCLLLGQARAQVICTDVNPDLVSTGNSTVDIDVDNDNTPDFRITSAQISTLGFVIVQGSQIGTSNFVLTNGNGDALALPPGAPIGASSTTWTQMNSTNQSMVIVAGATTLGLWAGATDQYLGLQFVTGSTTYYGWARFSFTGPMNTFTFKDYAYESTPGATIAAGQGCASVATPVIMGLADSVCAGSTLNFTANTGTSAASGYTWNIQPSGTISAANASVTSVTAGSGGPYTISLSTSSGTVNGITSSTFMVLAYPTITVSASAPAACAGSTIALTAIHSIANSFTWMPQTGVATPFSSVTTVTPPATQVYTVSVGWFGCVATQTALVTVQMPINISTHLLASGSAICAQPHNLSPAAIGYTLAGAPGYTMAINPPPQIQQSVVSHTEINVSHQPPAPGSSTPVQLTLTATDGVCTASHIETVVISPNPTVVVMPSSTSLCEGDTDSLQASGASAYFWLWTGTAGTITPGPAGMAAVSATANSTFSVFGSQNGCYSETSTVSVTVKPDPQLTVTSRTVCLSATVTFTASGEGTLNWYDAGGSAGTGTMLQVAGLNTGVHNYTVTAEKDGCTTSALMTVTVGICEGLESHQPNPVRVYPQPATGKIILESDVALQEIGLFDLDGRALLQARERSRSVEIDLSGLPPGVYVISARIESGGAIRQRILKH